MNFILRTNATPIYSFLSLIDVRRSQEEITLGKKILDCGAGGSYPPLALFHQHGFETYGIDVSDEQLERAREFCELAQISINLRKGDMRALPFEDHSFDYVYEHYSMCHLSKVDTAQAISEMHRVLKDDGLGFLGVISMDTWPKSIFGKERDVPGEYWSGDPEEDDYFHTMFADNEADQLVASWRVLSKEKRCVYLPDPALKMSLTAWMEIDDQVRNQYSRDAWQQQYEQRANMFQYVHLYYFLQNTNQEN